MKDISLELQSHLSSEVVDYTILFRIDLQNGGYITFNNYPASLTFNGQEYPAERYFEIHKDKSSNNKNNNYAIVKCSYIDGVISEQDIANKILHFAKIEMFIISPNAISFGKITSRYGYIDEIKYDATSFSLHIRPISYRLNGKITSNYSQNCRTAFADSKCGLNIANFTSVSSVTSQAKDGYKYKAFYDENLAAVITAPNYSDGYFNFGRIKFTSGANANIEMNIRRSNAAGYIELFTNLPYKINSGDSYEIIAGCDKQFSTCISKYNNAVNFRGEPHIPGNSKLLNL